MGDRAVVMNVIDPVVDRVCALHTDEVEARLLDEGPHTTGPTDKNAATRTIGVIGTKATIDSGSYEKKILARATENDITRRPAAATDVVVVLHPHDDHAHNADVPVIPASLSYIRK